MSLLLFQSNSPLTVVCHSHELPLFPFSQTNKIPNCHLSCFIPHQQVPFWRFQSFLWHCCLSHLTNKSRFLLGRWSVIFILQWSKQTSVQSVFNQKKVSRTMVKTTDAGLLWWNLLCMIQHLTGRQLALASLSEKVPLVQRRASASPGAIHST